MSTSSSTRVERRAGQRFSYLLPVSFRNVATGTEGVGFTQDVSSRGVFFFTDSPLHQGTKIELTLNMPSEITLGESMKVRCQAQVLRVIDTIKDGVGTYSAIQPEKKIGVAVRLEGYEYLPESTSVTTRASALHPQSQEERRTGQPQSHPDLP